MNVSRVVRRNMNISRVVRSSSCCLRLTNHSTKLWSFMHQYLSYKYSSSKFLFDELHILPTTNVQMHTATCSSCPSDMHKEF